MKEYICKEVSTDNGGYLEPVKELICCKDCRYWPYKSMPYASDEKYTEHYPHCFDFASNGYCYLAKRDERRMINKDEIVVAFMSPKNAKEMSLPDDAQVVTGLLDDDTIIVVPKDEFLDWLFEQRGEE